MLLWRRTVAVNQVSATSSKDGAQLCPDLMEDADTTHFSSLTILTTIMH